MSSKKLALILVLLLWAAGVAWGFVVILRYEAAAGASGQTPKSLPEPARADGHKMLFLLAHPRCPCTRATLAELEQILTHRPASAEVHVWFFQPANRPLNWSQGSSWSCAAELPGVQVHADVDGRKAKELGARTSGQVVLFDESGRLLFSGGITGARGHQGHNPGCQAVLDLLQGSSATVRDFPVFGCSLFDPEGTCCEDPSSCRN